MKNYEKPVVLMSEDLAEGIYAASGDVVAGATDTPAPAPAEEPECWTISVSKDQTDAGGYSTFRIQANHISMVHISTATTCTLVFSDNVTGAEYEGFEVSVSGCTVTLKRESHANAYTSHDEFNSLLKIWTSGDLASIQCVSATIQCTKTVNVQGGY